MRLILSVRLKYIFDCIATRQNGSDHPGDHGDGVCCQVRYSSTYKLAMCIAIAIAIVVLISQF